MAKKDEQIKSSTSKQASPRKIQASLVSDISSTVIEMWRLAEHLTDNSRALVIGWDATGSIRIFNSSAVEITGLDKSCIIGQNVNQPLKKPDSLPSFIAELREWTANENSFKNIFESHFTAISGEKHIITWRTSKITDSDLFIGIICFGLDVTKHKKAEENLHISEKRFRQLVENARDSIVSVCWYPRLRFEYVSPAVATITGCDLHQFYHKPTFIFDYIFPEDLQRLMGNINTERDIFRWKHPQGHTVWLEYNATPIYGTGSKIIGVLGMIRDITGRKEEEDIHRARELQLQQITDNMLDMIVEIDAENRYIYASPSHKDTLGFEPQQLIGRSILELIHPDDQERSAAFLQEAVETITPKRFEFRCRHADGHYVWLECGGQPLVNEFGEFSGGILGVHDITERKKAELALRESEERFRDLFENANDYIYIHDLKGNFTNINNAAERMFGYTKEEALSMNYKKIIAPEYLTLVEQIITHDVKNGITPNYEIEVLAKNGYRIPVELRARLIISNGRPVAVQGIARDISERKRVEDQLRYLSFHDSLTGLYNRAYFEEEMRRLEHSRQYPVGLIMCDLDGLKLINDTMGHRTGDGLLIATATLIKRCFRDSDLISRVGGDEFAIVLPNSTEPIVAEACKRIRDTLVAYNDQKPPIPLSISIGYAVSTSADTRMSDLFKKADNEMYSEKLHTGLSARSAIIQTLIQTLETRDFINEGHAHRLQDLVIKMSHELNLSDRSLSDMKLLAQFHDIGKVGIPDHILFKQAKLTPEEKQEIRRHCEIGHRIALSSPELVPIADWILKHHEWWNGEGYPFGLKSEDIPLECRILAIADAYDAMTSNRPYRQAMSKEKAIKELKKGSGTQFQPDLVQLFLKIV
ncbi:MAG: PAS domain S-box protein [Acidobacteriota bacterium]